MKILLAAAPVFGSTVGVIAGASCGDYRDCFDMKPMTVVRAPRSATAKTYPVDRRCNGNGARDEMHLDDDGGFGRTPDVRPRSGHGGYVPKHPRTAWPDGFWGAMTNHMRVGNCTGRGIGDAAPSRRARRSGLRSRQRAIGIAPSPAAWRRVSSPGADFGRPLPA